jgi:hypothetical protein
MSSVKKRWFILAAVALLVAAYVGFGRTPAARPTIAKQPAVEIERAPDSAARPLDQDFKAAMQHDSKAAAPDSRMAR